MNNKDAKMKQHIPTLTFLQFSLSIACCGLDAGQHHAELHTVSNFVYEHC